VAIIVISLHVLLTKTKFGIAMRATIENPDLAQAVGVNADLVYKVSWFFAGGLAGLAGSLLPLRFIGNPDTGVYLLISVFAASIAGGVYSIYGGLIGGYIVGIAEVLVTSNLALMFGSWVVPYRPAIPLLTMIVILLLAPRGITGLTLRKPLKLRRSPGETL
jgi:branched-chain amino acid transport system permease protein